MQRYVECRFRPDMLKCYTYHVDDDALAIAPGERIEVDARGSIKTVEVVGVSDQAPPYETKPILRKAVPEPADPEVANDPIGDVGAGE